MRTEEWVQTLELMARHLPLEICPYCGYALTGLPRGHVCPECGVACNPDEIVLFGRDPTRGGEALPPWELPVFLAIAGAGVAIAGITKNAQLGVIIGVAGVILTTIIHEVFRTPPVLSPLTPLQLRLSTAGFGIRRGLGPVKMKPWKRSHCVSLTEGKCNWRLRVEVPGRIPGIVWARPVNFAFGAPPEAAEGLREIGRRLAEGKGN